MGRTAILIGVIAILCGVYYFEIGSFLKTVDREIKDRIQPKPKKVWKLEELEKYRHVSVYGHVFDVSSEPRFYGPEGHYNLFTGVDATRAFALSDLSGESLISKLDGLSATHYQTAFEALDLYQKKYPFVGYLHDLYFDFRGRPKPLYHEIREAVKTYEKNMKEEGERYPVCNAFSSEKENYVDCIDGYQGEWYPRLVSLPSNPAPRCACLQLNFLNTGRLALYPGCAEFASKCSFTSEQLDALIAKFQGGSK